MVSASDQLRVRFFSQSLTGPAFGWYTSLPPDSVRTWKQLEEQYHSEATEAGIADLTQVRQRRGETVSEYIQRFRTVKNRCYSIRLSEKEAVELAIAGLSAPLKDLTFQADYNSLAHMGQKLTSYEQRHPELYQDKFKRVALVETEEEDSAEDQEVAVAEWARGAVPVSCKCIDLAGDGKLGYGFTSADELEEIDIGPGDKPRPTFISKKLDPQLRSRLIALLKEYPDCFAWDYTEMPGLDRSIIRASAPSEERISAVPAARTTDEGRNLGGSQERDPEDVGRRVHQAMQQDRPFYIYLSVADTSIASVVVQVYDGLERVVFYLSRRMLDAETRYLEIEKLCLCLFFTCTKIQHIMS
ncbi:hypothetical protein QYE76_045722 [Lolium multiflorum]|uniref:Retrotransposon gag domain-containing protein n=1 Tax=Lolium multiflorum TaxID=4521 RepID=A0AAD8WYG5_LOLMU|nr:hypothetical protein QYE76_045722 [Lolium multiflorum]